MISIDELKLRRKFFKKSLTNNSIAVFFSKNSVIKGDGEYFDFVDSNIFYFTNITQENTRIVFYKDKNGKIKEYLFIEKNNKFYETWIGEKISKKKAKEISGIATTNIFYLEDFDEKMEKLYSKIDSIYFFDNKIIGQYFDYENYKIKINEKYPKLKIENSYKLVANLRQIKSKHEVQEIKKATKITNDALKDVFKEIKNIKSEEEIDALITYNYIKNQSVHAFHPIIASGKNACIMHYNLNNNKIGKNDLILIDTGAEINKYSADISRTIPRKGKFTKRQKEVYLAVLDVLHYGEDILKPGITLEELHIKTYFHTCEKLIELGLFTKKEFEKNKKIGQKYFPHGIGHFLGLDSHDIGDYAKPLEEGNVITIEPGIYIKEEEIGIRIEDNFLITKTGNINLSKNIPKEIKEIEEMMREN